MAMAEQARRAVDSLAAAGADFIKVYSRLAPEAFRAAAYQAARRGLAVVGHVPSLVTAADAAGAGTRPIEHLQQLRRPAPAGATSCSRVDGATGSSSGAPRSPRV